MIDDPEAALRSIERLEGPRLTLRRFTEDDASAVFAYGSDPETVRHLIWAGCATEEEALLSLRNVLIPHPGVFAIAWSGDNRCIGCIDIRLDAINEKAGFGYVLNREHWNKGVMTEALSLVLDLAFNRLELHRVESNHFLGNAASGRVMTKCGMVWEGVLRGETKVKGEFRDSVHYGVLRSEWEGTGK